jgi:hypothetical protein
MVKTYRQDNIKAMLKGQDLLEKKKRAGKIGDEEIVFALIKRYMPSKREFSYVRMPIQIDQNGEPNAYAMASGVSEIRKYNKKNKHNQEIVSLWVPVTLANGKQGKRALLQIAYGEFADSPIKLTEVRIAGEKDKLDRLRDKKRRGKKVKQAADRLEDRIYS